MQYSAMQYSAMQYSAMQYSAASNRNGLGVKIFFKDLFFKE
jgi:hypothetical protein